jgi:hypothetical protein
MATSTDSTAFRTITEDGMLEHEGFTVDGQRLVDFEIYADAGVLDEGMGAQWYVPRTDELLAEYSVHGGLVVYPAADLFD